MTVVQRLSPLALCLALGLAGCGGGTAPQGPVGCPAGVVSCSSAAQCPSGNSCSAAGCCQAAAGCTTSANCTDPANPHCDAATNTCKPCASNAQCAGGNICVVGSGHCEAPCNPSNQGSDCTGTGKGQCRSQGGISFCAQCSSDSQCSGATPACVNGTCFGCSDNTTCSGATAACDASSHRCVACLDAANTNGTNPTCSGATPACKGAQCVACNAAGNDATSGKNPSCTGNAQVCDDSTNKCVGCTKTSQCSTGQYCDASAGNQKCKAPVIASLTHPNATVFAGTSETFTITIDVPAPSDIVVALTITGGGTLSAPTVTIPATKTSATFVFTAPPAPTDGTVLNLSIQVSAQIGTAAAVASSFNVTSSPPTLLSPGIASLTVQSGLAVPLAVTLSNTFPANITVGLAASPGGIVALPSTVVVAGGATTQAFNITPQAAGTTTVTATCQAPCTGSWTLPITVFSTSVSALTPGSATSFTNGAAFSSGVVPMTVTLGTPVPANATVVVSLTAANVTGNASPINGSFTAGGAAVTSVSVPAGQTQATFNFLAGSTTQAVNITASASGSNKTAAITVQPRVQKVELGSVDGSGTFTASVSNSFAVPTSAAIRVTLDNPATTDTRVYLADAVIGANPAFTAIRKFGGQLSSSAIVKAGSSSSITVDTGADKAPVLSFCFFLPVTVTADYVQVFGYVPGSEPQQLATPAAITPNTASPNNVSQPLCPLLPEQADHAVTYSNGGPTPLPLYMTTLVPNNIPATASISIALAATTAPGGSTACGTFTVANAAATSVTVAASKSRASFGFVPLTTASGPCYVTATATAGGTGLTLTNTTSTSIINIVAAPASAPTDLLLNKIEYDQGGSTNTKQFIELYNPTAGTISLAAYSLVLVGTQGDAWNLADFTLAGTPPVVFPAKNKAQYGAVSLSDSVKLTGCTLAGAATTLPASIGAGGFLTLQLSAAALGAAAPATEPVCNLPAVANTTDFVFETPGGIFLVNTTTTPPTIVDGFTWGGAIIGGTSATINPTPPNLFTWPPPGTAPLDVWIGDNFVAGSVFRVSASGQPSIDWAFSNAATNVASGQLGKAFGQAGFSITTP